MARSTITILTESDKHKLSQIKGDAWGTERARLIRAYLKEHSVVMLAYCGVHADKYYCTHESYILSANMGVQKDLIPRFKKAILSRSQKPEWVDEMRFEDDDTGFSFKWLMVGDMHIRGAVSFFTDQHRSQSNELVGHDIVEIRLFYRHDNFPVRVSLEILAEALRLEVVEPE